MKYLFTQDSKSNIRFDVDCSLIKLVIPKPKKQTKIDENIFVFNVNEIDVNELITLVHQYNVYYGYFIIIRKYHDVLFVKHITDIHKNVLERFKKDIEDLLSVNQRY